MSQNRVLVSQNRTFENNPVTGSGAALKFYTKHEKASKA
jgi:hypothetical protein